MARTLSKKQVNVAAGAAVLFVAAIVVVIVILVRGSVTTVDQIDQQTTPPATADGADGPVDEQTPGVNQQQESTSDGSSPTNAQSQEQPQQ